MKSGTSANNGEIKLLPHTQMLEDRVLLERFVQTGDEKAFEALVRRHGPMVLGVCRRILHDFQAAEDAFQATFLVLLRKAPSLTRPHLLGNWLFGVAYRTAMKARGQAIRRARHERQAMTVATVESAAETEAVHEMRNLLDGELKQLPAKYRAPLVLCYLEGMTNQEAAEQLGWPSGSMSYRLARGRELLRKRLSKRNKALASLAFGMLLARSTTPVSISDQVVNDALQAAAALSGHALPVAGLATALAGLPNPKLGATPPTLRGGKNPAQVAKSPKVRPGTLSLLRQRVPTSLIVAVLSAALVAGGLTFAYAISTPTFSPTKALPTNSAKGRVLETATLSPTTALPTSGAKGRVLETRDQALREGRGQPELLEKAGDASSSCHR